MRLVVKIEPVQTGHDFSPVTWALFQKAHFATTFGTTGISVPKVLSNLFFLGKVCSCGFVPKVLLFLRFWFIATIKKLQFFIRNYFSAILSNFVITIKTNYYAIICGLAAFFNWNTWYSEPVFAFASCEKPVSPSTLSATVPIPIFNFLSSSSICNCSSRKPYLHKSPPNPFTWRKIKYGAIWWLYNNNKRERTGIIIAMIDRLWVTDTKYLRLKQPVYTITDCSYCGVGVNLIDIPDFKQAKELAELWYANKVSEDIENCKNSKINLEKKD